MVLLFHESLHARRNLGKGSLSGSLLLTMDRLLDVWVVSWLSLWGRLGWERHRQLVRMILKRRVLLVVL
jgi:hypothetical protein